MRASQQPYPLRPCLAWGLWLGLSFLLAGCVALPMPVPVGCVLVPSTSGKVEHGRKITLLQTAFIIPGRTTRAEVVARLGDDFRDSPRVSALAYSWEYNGTKLAWVYGYDQGVADITGWQALFVAFDRDGRVIKVQSCRLYHLGEHKSLDEQLEAWAERYGAAPAPATRFALHHEN